MQNPIHQYVFTDRIQPLQYCLSVVIFINLSLQIDTVSASCYYITYDTAQIERIFIHLYKCFRTSEYLSGLLIRQTISSN